MDRILKKVANYLQLVEYTPRSEKMILAVSGGADSIALVHIIRELYPDIEYTILHINHNIREDSGQDQDFVTELAESLNIKIIVESLELDNTSEELMRNKRYEIFTSYAKKLSCDILTAHNANDNVETIIHNLFRGGSYDLLKGIPFKRNIGTNNVLRPLLCLRRDEIELFLREIGSSWQTDSSNTDISYTRNFIRHNILAQIIERYGIESIDRVTKTSILTTTYLDLCQNTLKSEYKRLPYSILKIESMDKSAKNFMIIGEVLKEAFSITGNYKDFSSKYVEIVLNGDNGQINENICFEHFRGSLFVYIPSLLPKIEKDVLQNIVFKPLDDNANLKSYNGVQRSALNIPENADISIRTFRKGEVIKNFNNKYQPYTEFLRNKRVPVFLRDIVPVLCIDDKPAWVIGVGISADFKISDSNPHNKEVIADIDFVDLMKKVN